MIEIVDQDIFKADIDILCHQTNCFNTFGSGIAVDIKKVFPEAYEADCKTIKGDIRKLGTFKTIKVKDASSRIKYVVNLYGQYGVSNDKRATSYDALADGFEKLENSLVTKGKTDLILGIPFGLGCGKGRGNTLIVDGILKSVFESSPVHLRICRK